MAFPAQTHVDSDAETRRLARTRTLALAGIIGPVWFTTLVIVQGLLQPDYSHMRMPISALTAWPAGSIQILNFWVFGALMTVFASGLHRGVRPTAGRVVGFALLVAGGIGVVAAGVFPWTIINGEPTATPAHGIAAVMAFAGTGLGFTVFSRRMSADPQWRDLATYTMSTGIAVLLLFVTIGVFAVDERTPLHPWAGLLQRVACAVWFSCMVVLALRIRKET